MKCSAADVYRDPNGTVNIFFFLGSIPMIFGSGFIDVFVAHILADITSGLHKHILMRIVLVSHFA
jgi:Na+-translocating ferredoxin:NAD+ oxidoreductase RnfE subunit